MTKQILLSVFLLPLFSFAQQVSVLTNGSKLRYAQLTLFLDKDTNSSVAQVNVTYDQLATNFKSSIKDFHSAFPFGPYNKNTYKNLNEYTPVQLIDTRFTSFEEKLNYNSFNYFNQAPLKKEFIQTLNHLNDSLYNHLLETQSNAEITSGVIYDGKKSFARVKVPAYFFVIFITDKKKISIWYLDAATGILAATSTENITKLAEANKNFLRISKNN
ncbi:MAG TPA: hypothetical protein VGB95_02850 [Chitinophagales bacterium]